MRIACLLPLLFLAACAVDRPNTYYWASKTQKEAINAQQMAVTAPGAVAGNVTYAPDRIDGSYQGTLYLTSTPTVTKSHWWRRPTIDDATCPHTKYGVIEIGDHVLYYAYAPNLVFNVGVGSDGSLNQTVANATLSGKVGLGRLTFDIVTPVCTTRFIGNFKLNHS